jgi:hypothetical protein
MQRQLARQVAAAGPRPQRPPMQLLQSAARTARPRTNSPRAALFASRPPGGRGWQAGARPAVCPVPLRGFADDASVVFKHEIFEMTELYMEAKDLLEDARESIGTTVRAAPGPLSAISVFLCKSVLYGAFVWAHRALNSRKWRFPARAVRRGRHRRRQPRTLKPF